MKIRLLAAVLFASIVVFGALPRVASAIPLNWTVSGSFDDGGTFAGSFTYDADTNAMSAFNLTTAGGNVGLFPGFVYSDATGGFTDLEGTDDRFIFCNTLNCVNPRWDLRLAFASPLTDAGGLVALLAGPVDPSPPQYGFECSNCGTVRFIVEAAASAAATPEPGTLALLGMALGGVAFYRRRRTAI